MPDFYFFFLCLREIPVNWQWDICIFNQKKHLVAKETTSNNVKIYLWHLHPFFLMPVTIVLRWTLLSSSAKADKPGKDRYLISVYSVLYEVVFKHFYFIWKFLKQDKRKNGMVYHKIKLVMSNVHINWFLFYFGMFYLVFTVYKANYFSTSVNIFLHRHKEQNLRNRKLRMNFVFNSNIMYMRIKLGHWMVHHRYGSNYGKEYIFEWIKPHRYIDFDLYFNPHIKPFHEAIF